MAGYEDVIQRAGSFRSTIGVTEADFMALLPAFEASSLASLQNLTIDGRLRTSRRYSSCGPCPLPMVAGQWCFMLTY